MSYCNHFICPPVFKSHPHTFRLSWYGTLWFLSGSCCCYCRKRLNWLGPLCCSFGRGRCNSFPLINRSTWGCRDVNMRIICCKTWCHIWVDLFIKMQRTPTCHTSFHIRSHGRVVRAGTSEFGGVLVDNRSRQAQKLTASIDTVSLRAPVRSCKRRCVQTLEILLWYHWRF